MLGSGVRAARSISRRQRQLLVRHQRRKLCTQALFGARNDPVKAATVQFEFSAHGGFVLR